MACEIAASVFVIPVPCNCINILFVINEFTLVLKFNSLVTFGSSLACQKFKGGRACTRINIEVYGSVNCHNFHKSQPVSILAKTCFSIFTNMSVPCWYYFKDLWIFFLSIGCIS